MDTNTLLALIRLDNTLEEFGHDIKRLKEQFAELDTKREPLNIADVENHLLLCDVDEGYIDGYIDGMVYAEREHKIRGSDE